MFSHSAMFTGPKQSMLNGNAMLAADVIAK